MSDLNERGVGVNSISDLSFFAFLLDTDFATTQRHANPGCFHKAAIMVVCIATVLTHFVLHLVQFKRQHCAHFRRVVTGRKYRKSEAKYDESHGQKFT